MIVFAWYLTGFFFWISPNFKVHNRWYIHLYIVNKQLWYKMCVFRFLTLISKISVNYSVKKLISSIFGHKLNICCPMSSTFITHLSSWIDKNTTWSYNRPQALIICVYVKINCISSCHTLQWPLQNTSTSVCTRVETIWL